MGSFYSTCSISHMTLTHQKTSIQLLVPTYKPSFAGHMGMMVFNEGPQGFFTPFAFPIHGTYDDYGHLCDIQHDDNTRMLEEFFNISIDQILQNIGDDRWYNLGEVENNSNWQVRNEDGTPMKNQEIFRDLGMTYIRTEILEFLEDGYQRWMPTDKKADAYSSEGMIKNLLKKVRTFKIKPKKEYTDDMVGNLRKKIQKSFPDKDDVEHMLKTIMSDTDYSFSHDNCYIPSLSKYNFYTLFELGDKFDEQITKQFQMLYTMGRGLNRLLLPSLYGSQQDNYTATFKLNELTNKLLVDDKLESLRRMIKERDTYDYGESESLEDYLEDYSMLEDYNTFKHLL